MRLAGFMAFCSRYWVWINLNGDDFNRFAGIVPVLINLQAVKHRGVWCRVDRTQPFGTIYIFQSSMICLLIPNINFLFPKSTFCLFLLMVLLQKQQLFLVVESKKTLFLHLRKFNVCTFDWPALISSRRRRRKGKSSETYHECVFGYPLGQFISIALERCSLCHSV